MLELQVLAMAPCLSSAFMKPQIKLAEAKTPEGETLELYEHDGDMYISANGEFLMTSRAYGSEEELGRMACQPFRAARQPVVLIGGLGMGFTLRAVLESVPQTKAKIIVAEIIPEVVDWNRTHLDKFHKGLLDDPRVGLKIGPVQESTFHVARPGVGAGSKVHPVASSKLVA